MKKLIIYLSIVLAVFISVLVNYKPDLSQSVNPILGDKSFVKKFGFSPDKTTNNELRIVTHLEYVESLLRAKDKSNLPQHLQIKRSKLLDLLHEYWTRGVFPKNYDFADKRVPCFIDKDGAICAVGYLIAQTAGRAVANNINDKYQYHELLAMNDKTIDQWLAESGLTREECAMIQPAYGPAPVYSYNRISPSYGVASSVWGGANLALSAINGIQAGQISKNKSLPIIGLMSGAGQIVYGAIKFPLDEGYWNGVSLTNESEKALSMINIGLGTTTMILSAWNLYSGNKKSERLTTWNINSFRTHKQSTGLALNVTRRF